MSIEGPKKTAPDAEKPASIRETEHSVEYLGVELAKAENAENAPKREQYEDYINDEFSLELQQKIAVSMRQGDPLLIEGGTSIGKTTTVKKMCADLGYEVHYVNLNGATDVEDLMGRYIPNHERKSPEGPEYVFADGRVTAGLRQEEGKVKVILLDEYNAASPNILIRLHEVLDALNRDGDVVLAEDASENISVSKERTKVVALMNPPGKGYLQREPLDPAQLRRWVYLKEPSELPKDTLTHATRALFNLEKRMGEPEEKNYLRSAETRLSPEQLAEIPGIDKLLDKYLEFHESAKDLIESRRIARDQPQRFSFDDREEPRRVRDFMAEFYRGDMNETMQRALRYYYAGKVLSAADKRKMEEIISTVHYEPPQAPSRRVSLAESVEAESVRRGRAFEPVRGTTLVISDGRTGLADYRVGDRLRIKVPPDEVSESVRKAKELAIEGFTSDDKVIISINGGKVIETGLGNVDKLYERTRTESDRLVLMEYGGVHKIVDPTWEGFMAGDRLHVKSGMEGDTAATLHGTEELVFRGQDERGRIVITKDGAGYVELPEDAHDVYELAEPSAGSEDTVRLVSGKVEKVTAQTWEGLTQGDHLRIKEGRERSLAPSLKDARSRVFRGVGESGSLLITADGSTYAVTPGRMRASYEKAEPEAEKYVVEMADHTTLIVSREPFGGFVPGGRIKLRKGSRAQESVSKARELIFEGVHGTDLVISADGIGYQDTRSKIFDQFEPAESKSAARGIEDTELVELGSGVIVETRRANIGSFVPGDRFRIKERASFDHKVAGADELIYRGIEQKTGMVVFTADGSGRRDSSEHFLENTIRLKSESGEARSPFAEVPTSGGEAMQLEEGVTIVGPFLVGERIRGGGRLWTVEGLAKGEETAVLSDIDGNGHRFPVSALEAFHGVEEAEVKSSKVPMATGRTAEVFEREFNGVQPGDRVVASERGRTDALPGTSKDARIVFKGELSKGSPYVIVTVAGEGYPVLRSRFTQDFEKVSDSDERPRYFTTFRGAIVEASELTSMNGYSVGDQLQPRNDTVRRDSGNSSTYTIVGFEGERAIIQTDSGKVGVYPAYALREQFRLTRSA